MEDYITEPSSNQDSGLDIKDKGTDNTDDVQYVSVINEEDNTQPMKEDNV